MKNLVLFRKLVGVLCFLFILQKSYAQPKASFTSDVTSGCTPLVVQFNDASSGSPAAWQWDLGNGAVSTQQNPSCTYLNPGTYTVKLTVKNNKGIDSVIKKEYVTVYSPPVVNFSSAITEGCPSLVVPFDDSSSAISGTITEHVWDFGDGTISSDSSPIHTYKTSGKYDVTLIVKNSFGCRQTLQKRALIYVYDSVKAGFNYDYENVCQPPSLINFNNTSVSKRPLTYQWSFGDESSSTSNSGSHTFNDAGTYNIQLIATTNQGCRDTANSKISIGTVTPDFTYSNACTDQQITFTNTSSVKPASVTWSFGDGSTASSIDAVHNYSVAGTYTVTLSADFGACKNSIAKAIIVAEKPVIDFAVSQNAACNLPVTVNFTNNTQGAVNYQWLFGDSTSSGETSPVHVYTKARFYNVSLIAYNGNGCSDTLTKFNAVRTGPPQIVRFDNLPVFGCAPAIVSPKAIINSPEPVMSYQWDFGDGTTSSDSLPAHTYSKAGNYIVKLFITTITGCTDSLVLRKAVNLGEVPKANFTAMPTNTCADQAVVFRDLSTGTITNWNWDFGDGGTSQGQNPSYNYSDTGYFDVKLIVSNDGCRDTMALSDFVHIAPPIASFKTLFDCASPYDKTFSDQSIGATTWNWSFGDGSSSTQQSPSHTYAAVGSYYAELTVTNGVCSYTTRDSVRVIDEKPLFTNLAADTACRKDSIKLLASNYTPANISSFYWNFGDGTNSGFSSAYTNIIHQYDSAGIFSPELITLDKSGCYDTVSNILKVRIYGAKPNFSNPEGICLNSTANFADQSVTDGIHPIIKWDWSFGDNDSASYSQGPYNHTYIASGVYDVKLTVYDTYGCIDSIIKPKAIEAAKPVAAFSAIDSIKCTKNTVSFKNTSAGNALKFIWNFGDNLTDTLRNPSHSYSTEGIYSIALKVTDKYGCADTLTKTDLVTISDPKASFTLQDSTGECPPLLTKPINTSINSLKYNWIFGDGSSTLDKSPSHVYTTGGKFTLTLVATGYGVCTDTAKKIISVKGPSGKLSYPRVTACNPTSITLNATVKHIRSMTWDLNDGTVLNTNDTVINYTYKNAGKFVPKLILTDSAGCRVGIENKDTINVADIKAAVHIEGLQGCDSASVVLNDSSSVFNDNVISYRWSFGDRSTSSEQNNTHVYRRTGNYKASLFVTTSIGCKDSVLMTLPVVVHPSPKVDLYFADTMCEKALTDFWGFQLTQDTIVKWNWNFAGLDSSFYQNPQYAFSKSGTLPVSLTGTNQFGCTNTATSSIVIIAPPAIDAGTDTAICYGNNITLKPRGKTAFRWVNDGTLNCSVCITPVATPFDNTTYYVIGVNSYGCAIMDSVHVAVSKPVYVKMTGDSAKLCLGETKTLTASGAQIYKWDPPLYLDDPSSDHPVFNAAKDTSITYRVTGYDSLECFSDTTYVKVKVYPMPQIQMDLDMASRTVNVGSSVQLKTKNSPDITQWRWSPQKYLDDPSSSSPISTPKESITYAVVGSNGGACVARAEVSLTVLCNGSNIFVPNTFSPNKDGMNDVFYPRGKGLFNIKAMHIFNRWGQLVFQKNTFSPNDASAGWDGSFKGSDLPSDVYVYMIDVFCDNNTVIPVKGNVTLIR